MLIKSKDDRLEDIQELTPIPARGIYHSTGGEDLMNDNAVVIYQSPDGSSSLEVHLDHETVWFAQPQLADLFDVNVPAISKHIRNILGSGELDVSATVSKKERAQKEGERKVKRSQVLYNLDIIISIGYRVNSVKATRFRIRATRIVRNHYV